MKSLTGADEEMKGWEECPIHKGSNYVTYPKCEVHCWNCHTKLGVSYELLRQRRKKFGRENDGNRRTENRTDSIFLFAKEKAIW